MRRPGPTDGARAFPRGLVLGLTMAEIAILIIFVLLLALAALLARETEMREEAENELVRFERLEAVFEGQELPEDPVLLQRVLRERVDEHEDAENWRELVREIETTFPAPSAANVVEQLQRAQERIARLEAQARSPGGAGTDNPSCWYDQDGTVAYLFDVALAADGFVVAAARAPQHEAERAQLPIGGVRQGRLLSEARFLIQTLPVYQWSVERECRFFVRAFDVTPADQKDLYKSRMQALESRFYKNANPTGGLPEELRRGVGGAE